MTLRQFSYEYRRALCIGQIMFIHSGDNSHIAKKSREEKVLAESTIKHSSSGGALFILWMLDFRC